MKLPIHLLPLALFMFIIMSLAACSSEPAASAEQASTPTPSAYRALLDTEIRGIDDQTIEDYLTGKGMGLALPAELNGYPGPRHVIDLAEDLALTLEQLNQVQALFDKMQPQAITLGEDILAAEAALEESFRTKSIDETNLASQLESLGELEAELRFVHLSTHLATIDILSPHQVMLYNSLRGYESMPADHDHHQHESG